MKIVLSEYDSDWPEQFEVEKTNLLAALNSKNLKIEHVGSTSVPGLIAKPIIDMMVGLQDFSYVDIFVPKIQQSGYTYFPQYEDIIPYRRFFKKTFNSTVTHHVHMVQVDSEFWNRHLLFRNYLRLNPDVAHDYGQLKQRLAEREWPDSNQFSEAKTEFIRAIEKRAEIFFNKGVT